MGETHVFKTAFSKYFSLVFISMAIIVSVRIAWSNPAELTQSVPILMAGAGIVGLLFYLPRVEVSDGGITMVNVLRTTHVPWPNFARAEARWNLVVTSTEGEHTSWALPASSGTARRLTRKVGEETQSNTAEGAAWAIGERYAALKNAGHIKKSTRGATQVETTINQSTLILGSIIILLLVLGFL